jgi:triacylglycerol lipase
VKDALFVSQKGFHVPAFSNETAANLAQLIEYAYSFSAGAIPGTYPPPFPSGLPTGYSIVALAQADDDFWGYTNAQYYGIIAIASGQIVIAIRGTDDISEWLIDFEFPLTPFLPISGAGLVEYGFLSVFSTLTFVDPNGKPFDLTAYLKSALASNPKTEIIIEGHSLGGPIACMLALVTADGNTALKNATTVYTFASPAPGDDAFASFYNSNAPQTNRIWNPWDLVPSAPPASFGYSQLAGCGFKLEPTLAQLEQYDFLSVDCNHSLTTYQWLLDSQFALPSSCHSALTAPSALTAADAQGKNRAARLQASLARMRARTLSEQRRTSGSIA